MCPCTIDFIYVCLYALASDVCVFARECVQVRELVDWMVGKTQRQAGAVLDFMHAHTRAEMKEQMVGTVGRTFESNRSQLVNARMFCLTFHSIVPYGNHSHCRANGNIGNAFANIA